VKEIKKSLAYITKRIDELTSKKQIIAFLVTGNLADEPINSACVFINYDGKSAGQVTDKLGVCVFRGLPEVDFSYSVETGTYSGVKDIKIDKSNDDKVFNVKLTKR